MCTAPINIRNPYGAPVTVACRKCEACIATATNDWVARAMAEKATAKQTISITLTYGSDTQEKRDGAKAFRYSDVSNMMKSIRQEISRTFGDTGSLRYLVAGETGKSGTHRSHWHAVLFSDHDLLRLGEWRNKRNKRPVKDRQQMLSPYGSDPRKIKMLLWSHWPHGHVVVQEPDRAGMQYVIKYAIKEQFNARKAKHTSREAKSSNTGAAMFRMSKFPPIGMRWVEQVTNELLEMRQVLPKLTLTPPGTTGYWRPSGFIRQQLIRRLAIINAITLAETGRNAPQWRTLLHSVEDQPSIWEELTNGEEKAEEWSEAEFASELLQRSKEIAAREKNKTIRRRCGGLYPCAGCVNGMDADEIKEFEQKYKADYTYLHSGPSGRNNSPEQKWRRLREPSPYCKQRELAHIKQAFLPLA